MKRLISVVALVMCLCTILGGVSVFATTNKSYTYSISGNPVDSPDAFTPDRQVSAAQMGIELSEPADLFVDESDNVYIVDSAANKVMMLDKFYKFKMAFGTSFINDQGVPDSLNKPNGMFITGDDIYVADTENCRIVVFDRNGEFKRIVEEPTSDIMSDDAIYKPIAISVDGQGNMYVVSSTTNNGIIVMNRYGVFQSYVGAQKVNVDPATLVWRQFMTAAQRAQLQSYVPTEYNNVTIDNEGFVYATISSLDPGAQQAAVMGNSSDNSPVKKLNSAGDDVMARSGFFGPGEVNIINSSRDETDILGPSTIVDVALGPEGTWTIVDQKRSKFYTYDSYGRLLHVFGDKGQMRGNIVMAEAIAYQMDEKVDENGEIVREVKLLCLDKTALNLTVYRQTEYGDILINALHNDNERKYEVAVDDWNSILQRNGNFDAAYVGIGKSLYREGKWEEAMEYYKYAYDTAQYSEAFKEYRKEWISDYVWVVPLVVIVVCLAGSKLFSWAGKVNKAGILKKGKRKFHEEVLYAFHLFGHPFDGFWDLKHEKRGSVRGATFWVVLAVVSFTYQAVGQAYLFNPKGATSSVFVQAVSILMPLFLVVTSNWCLTTLMDGEGSYKDVYIACGYSLAPLPFFVIPSVLLTHVFSLNEAGIVSLLVSIGWIWVGLLVFFGLQVTHAYSIIKNVLTCAMTIVGAGFIMFLGLLFTGLIQKIVGFISSIITELSYRM
ncbi:MAG: YIP1 family protein [Clostridia bacterium]|nr:YIP1 family protein [Clostridia bacterium]